jgi:hypothetical protein
MEQRTSGHPLMGDHHVAERYGRHLRKVGQARESHLSQQGVKRRVLDPRRFENQKPR